MLVTYQYDSLDRVVAKYTTSNDIDFTERYTYVQPTGGAGDTSNRIATYSITTDSYTDGYTVTYSYTYDNNGNILSVSDGTCTTSYVYDSLNQLIRENNQASGITYTWEYDNSGNVLCRSEFAYTTDPELEEPEDTVFYEYDEAGWGDLLNSYNGGLVQFYGGNLVDDESWEYDWEHGNELVAMTAIYDGTVWRFSYNADGMRLQRTDGTTTYKYVYNGSQLSQMTVGSDTLRFTYDADGTPLTVIYNGVTYYYVTNLQGDVVAILNSSGAAVAAYAYDAWGDIIYIDGLLPDFADLNPLRYRGYVYDIETGLYYLQSRYYNPYWGRFISADSVDYLGADGTPISYNLFAYCGNNPLNWCDPCGTCKHYWYLFGLIDCKKCKKKHV